MSIQSEVDRINGNVASTYSVLSDLGADMPATTNTNNLPATATSVKAVLFGKSQSLTEAQKAQARTNIGAVSAEDVGNIATTEEIVQQVIAALGTPVFGTVDENNNITLTGNLADGTYTIKYEDADGEQTTIGTLKRISYTNQIPISTDTDGSIYNSTGYKTASRCNSSGAVADCTGGTNPPFVTGFIPVKHGDVIRLKNCYVHAFNDTSSTVYGTGAWGIRCGLYNSSKTNVAVFSWGNFNDGASSAISGFTPVQDNWKCTEFTILGSNAEYLRITLAADVDNGFTPADAILTVNEEID